MRAWADEEDDRAGRCVEMPYGATVLSAFQHSGSGSFNGDARYIGNLIEKRYGRLETQITGFSSLLQAYHTAKGGTKLMPTAPHAVSATPKFFFSKLSNCILMNTTLCASSTSQLFSGVQDS